MESIIGLSADSKVSNLGKGGTAQNIGTIISCILTPKDWKCEFTVGDTDAEKIADFEDAVSDMLLNNDPEQRGFYIGPFEQFDDRGEATQFQTMGYGGKFETRSATISDEYTFVNQGVDFWKKMLTFKGKHRKYKLLKVDNQGIVCGTNYVNPTTGLVTGIKGYALSDLTPQNRKQATGSAVEMHMLNYTLQKASEANEDLFTVDTGKDYDGVISALAIQDVTIQATGVMVAKVVSCAITSCGVNLCEALPGIIVSASFEFENVATGSTVINLTSVAIVDGLAKFTFAGTGAGWDDGEQMVIRLKSVSTLAGAGFEYFESTTTPECIVVMED